MSPRKRFLLQVASGLNTGNFDHVSEWFTADFRLHEPAQPDWPRGHEGARRILAEIRDKIPGVRVEALIAPARVILHEPRLQSLDCLDSDAISTQDDPGRINNMVEEGDRVAVRWLFSATREGEPRHLSAVAIYCFTGGLISEDWGIATRAAWP